MHLVSYNTVNQESGFTLLELMIVVSIIGVLSSVALPTFKRFQLRAKQSEAKTQLAAFYVAQAGFYQEWSTYFGDFRDIGYNPEGSLGYRVGFGSAGTVRLPSRYRYGGGAGKGNVAVEFHTGKYCLTTSMADHDNDPMTPDESVSTGTGNCKEDVHGIWCDDGF